MDNSEKLSEGLLKADGIDPARATESERIAFGKTLDEPSELRQSRPCIVWLDSWRRIMKHKLTKLAVAAGILVPITIGINRLGISVDGTTVALADVAKRLEQVKNCVFRKAVVFTADDGKSQTNNSKVYYAQAGMRQDNYHKDDITSQTYLLYSQKRIVWMDHGNRLYGEINLTDEDIEKHTSTAPKDIVNEILSKGKYKELGKKAIDGFLAEGFEFSDKRTLLSMDREKTDDVVVRIWVDVNTVLPVRIEMDCVYNGVDAQLVMSDPQWDVELVPDFFEPKIPSDYMRPEQRGLIGIDIEDWPTLKVGSGTAAEKAGVKDGDVVLKVNGNSISHIESSGDALILLSGKAGEKVALTVRRGEQILTFEIERAPSPK